MPNNRPTYREELLHWIWENRQFASQNLQTTHENNVAIHFPGYHNKSDGPDFLRAEITIGHLRWYGDIEIHWKLSDWRNHNHQQDSRYNNVILHVVFEETKERIQRQDQTKIPTFCLSHYVSQPLESFLVEYLRHPQLPCAKHLSYISEEAFLKQLNKAHKEYFEQKVEDLLEFYDPNLPPSKAWIKLLVISLFDGLGISHNRKAMGQLAHILLQEATNFSSAESLTDRALAISGLHKREHDHATDFEWNHKGCRPNNHPEKRIPQAVLALWHIIKQPFQRWMQEAPKELWEELININTKKLNSSIGKERSEILFGTVFLPALYLLGQLFHSAKIKNRSWSLWKNHRVSLPKSLLRRLNDTELESSVYKRKLGTIYQLRHYCKAGRCQKCFVFKNEISS